MKQLFFAIFLILISSNLMFAQAPPQAPPNQQTLQQIQTQIINPVFITEDVVFVFQTFNAIEITGNEIDAFLNAKKTIQGLIKKAQDEKKQLTDTMKTELQVQTAQDILTFLQRGKFAGANAEKFKRFVDAIIEAAKALNLQPKK